MSKLKLAYVITSEGLDFFTVMTRVSLASVRISNPWLHIVLVCDHITSLSLSNKKDPILKEVDEVVSVEVIDERPIFRNRYIKTQLKKYISGKVLFVDSDILVRRCIKEVFQLTEDVALAPNHSELEIKKSISRSDKDTFQEMNWELPTKIYYNGGVIFYNDTPGAEQLSVEWINNWTQTSSQTGKYRDQPSLNHSLLTFGGTIHSLPIAYNAQIKPKMNVTIDAKIWHFYSTEDSKEYFYFERYVQELLIGKEELDYAVVAKMIANKYPFFGNTLAHHWVARKVVKTNKISLRQANYLSNSNLGFFKKIVNNRLRK